MKSKLIDANVILRYLLKDDESMSVKAREVIHEGAFTLPEVLAEVIYVLRSVYHVERTEIAEALFRVVDDVEVSHRDVILFALGVFRDSSLDFVDCILVAYREVEGLEVFSFDKKLNRRLSSI